MSASHRKALYRTEAREIKNLTMQLATDFSLSLVDESADVYGLELLYQNHVAGIQFEFSPAEQRGWRAVVGRLVDGKFPRHPIFIDRSTTLNRFDIRDAAAASDRLPPELSKKIENMEPLVATEVVEIVRLSCSKILGGDFTDFPKLSARVYERLP